VNPARIAVLEDVGIELSRALSEQVNRIFIQGVLLASDVNLSVFEIDVVPFD
jgi:hypothetical protein